MTRRITALLLTMAAAVPAAAQGVDQDVRCILAGNAFAVGEKDQAKKQLALATALFFAGRADARLSAAQLKAAVATQSRALTTATIANTMTACARSFQTKQRALQAIGRDVAQAQTAAPASPKK